jgi:hypothetical protein
MNPKEDLAMLPSQTRHAPIIAPHYLIVSQEFSRLHDKLSRALRTRPRSGGPAIHDGLAALSLWEQWLRESASRLPGGLRRLSATILAQPRRPDPRRTMAAVIAVEQEVGRLIHLHRHLTSHPLAPCHEEGRRLLLRCLDNLAQDLLELFAFFTNTMAAHSQSTPARPGTHVWTRPLTCGPHWSAYQAWQQTCLPATRSDRNSRWQLPLRWRRHSGKPAPGTMPRMASLAAQVKKGLTYLITREKTQKAPCCC